MQSPQMIQAMKILQLGSLDLQERIEQELVENPMLEEVEPDRDGPGGEESPGTGSEVVDREREEVSRMLEDLESLQRDFGDGGRGGDGEEGDRKLQALANAPDVPRTMAEALSEELAFLELSRRKRAIELDHPRRFSQRYEAASRTLRKLLRFSHGNIVIA